MVNEILSINRNAVMFWTRLLLLLCSIVGSLGQNETVPNLARGDLTVNIVVKYPEDTLEEYGYFNSPFYLYGNGLCLSWDQGSVMEHTREDTWEITLTYSQTPLGYGCNDPSVPGLIDVNGQFEYRVVINDTVEMLGANCGSSLPISMSAPYYEESPEVYCNPWFFTTQGSVLIEAIEGEPELMKTRNMHFYLPPSFHETFYKQYPVVFAPDVGYGLPDFMFNQTDRMQMFRHNADEAIVTQAIMEEVIFIGTADYKLDPRNPILTNDRFDLLGPVNPMYSIMCANGTFFEGCDGCFDIADIENVQDIIDVLTTGGCGGMQPIGGSADIFLDFLLNEVLDFTLQIAEDRALIDQEHLGVFGCSLGGLFSCYAGWTRPESFAHAGCQSSSFWYPYNETQHPQYDFERIFIHQHRDNRPFQNVYMDFSVPGDTLYDLRMAEAALNLGNSMAELPVFQWNRNLWLDGFMGKTHGFNECMERAWIPLAEFYTPIGGPRNPLTERPPHQAPSGGQENKANRNPFVESVQDLKNIESADVEIKKIIDLLK